MIHCSRCQRDLKPEEFAPSQRKAGAWCRSCRAEYMRVYARANPAKFRRARRCGTCGSALPQVGGCLNGCTQRVAPARDVLRTTTCTICKQPFVIPTGARSNLRTCNRPSCQETRARQRKARGGVGRTRGGKAPHHRGTYHVTAAKVRANANANPDTKCWRCGRTLAQHPPHKNGKPAKWTAGHRVDGQVGGPLAPEASTCNYSAGATTGNQRRGGTDLTW